MPKTVLAGANSTPTHLSPLGAGAKLAFETDLGWMALWAEGCRVQRLNFGHPTQAAALAALQAEAMTVGLCPLVDEPQGWLRELRDDLHDYAAGRPVDFGHVLIDEAGMTPFVRAVIRACRQIPRGRSKSYGDLAAQAGSPGAARAVGQVMATNRTPLIVPCHRVIAANRRLGGFSAPEGAAMKRRLLDLEGIVL